MLRHTSVKTEVVTMLLGQMEVHSNVVELQENKKKNLKMCFD